jgi:hypothetical protein
MKYFESYRMYPFFIILHEKNSLDPAEKNGSESFAEAKRNCLDNNRFCIIFIYLLLAEIVHTIWSRKGHLSHVVLLPQN